MDAKKVSILSAIAASSCCLPPLILLGLTLAGIGTAGVAGLSSTLGSLKWYMLPLAVVGLTVSYFLYFREKRKCSRAVCRMANEMLTKTLLTLSTVVVVAFLTWSVYPYVLGSGEVEIYGSGSSAHFAMFQVEGMTCGGCELAIDGAVAASGLVDSVKSRFMEGKTYVWYSTEAMDTARVLEAIGSVGYNARLLNNKEDSDHED